MYGSKSIFLFAIILHPLLLRESVLYVANGDLAAFAHDLVLVIDQVL